MQDHQAVSPPEADAPLPDLDGLLRMAWALLQRGARDRHCVAHTPTLASLEAGEPRLRTVVLRAFEPTSRELFIYTDTRSPKFAQLRSEPRSALHVYDPAQNLQLRLRVDARLHHDDDLADRHWAQSRPTSRLVYGSPLAPGVPVPEPRAAAQSLQGRTDAEQRAHFAVVVLKLIEMDLLLLARAGHRRACYRWEGDGPGTARWLMP